MIPVKYHTARWFFFLILFLILSCSPAGTVKHSDMNSSYPQIPADAMYYVTGLISKTVKEGKGAEKPGPEDSITAGIATRTDADPAFKPAASEGKMMTELSPMLSEAFQLMTPGQQVRVWIPAEKGIAPAKDTSATYIAYDLELFSFKRLKDTPQTPTELISPSK